MLVFDADMRLRGRTSAKATFADLYLMVALQPEMAEVRPWGEDPYKRTLNEAFLVWLSDIEAEFKMPPLPPIRKATFRLFVIDHGDGVFSPNVMLGDGDDPTILPGWEPMEPPAD